MNTAVRSFNVIRLAAFALGYGLTGALMGGTLNRVMVADLGISIALVGLFFAVPSLVTPLRVWLGYRSDGFPIFGKRREPYMIMGSLITAVGVVLAVFLSISQDPASPVLTLGVMLAFIIYGFGRNLAHNTFQALITDKFSQAGRVRAITAYEVVTLFGLVMGAGGLGRALETFEPNRLVSVSIGAVAIAFVLTLLAALRNEPAQPKSVAEKAREVPFTQVFKQIALADRQVRLFFIIIMFTIVGTLAQDVILEPYGALVLNMEVGETTRLTSFWGIGVIISMLISGMVLIRKLGYLTVLRIGLVASAIAFIGVIAAGAAGQPGMFRGLVFVMGLGTGIAGAGMLAGFVTFSTALRAGLLMGVWGTANMLGRALGSLLGGSIAEVIYVNSGDALVAYGAVFALEVLLLAVAFGMTLRLNVGQSAAQHEAELSLATS